MVSLSVIVPAYNEGENLHAAVLNVMTAARRADLADFDVIVVNDGSTDSTWRVADDLARHCVEVRVIHHEGVHGSGVLAPLNRGLRAAYESGLTAASMEYVTWIPGDGEMALDSITAIFRAVGTADLVIPFHGTPERRTWLRRLLTWGSTTQLNWLLGHSLHYFQGTVVYPAAMARRLPRTEAGFFVMAEQLAHALDEGCTYVEIPLEHQERLTGVSKAVGWSKVWAAQKLILRLWWDLRVRPFGDVLAYAAGGPV